MALEYYDSFFRKCPAQLAEYTGRRIEDARAAFAAAAEREAAHAQLTPSGKVAETRVAIARPLAERPVGIHRVTMLLAAVVAFAALCISAGYSLAAPMKPFWVANRATVAPVLAGHVLLKPRDVDDPRDGQLLRYGKSLGKACTALLLPGAFIALCSGDEARTLNGAAPPIRAAAGGC
jgi:hypothetical protein